MRRALMMSCLYIAAAGSAAADIAPIEPPPPPPNGPAAAVIRGLSVEQVYTYWKGRRWLVTVAGCDPAQEACKGIDVAPCFVTGIDGQALNGGDVAALIAAESAAGDKPLKLDLEHCPVNGIELQR
jgi:hypothetical protein